MQRTAPAFHGQPEIKQAATFTEISSTWESTNGLPQWLGWLVSHVLGRMASQHASRPNPKPETQQEHQRLSREILDSIPLNADLAPVKRQLWEWLLETCLPQTLEGIPNNMGIPKIMRRTAKLRRKKDSDKRVPSQDWDELAEALTNVHSTLHQGADRKILTNQDKEDRRCLMYIIDSLRYASQKNSHEALANAFREAINAMSCHTDAKSAEINELLFQILLENLSAAQPAPPKKLPPEQEPDLQLPKAG